MESSIDIRALWRCAVDPRQVSCCNLEADLRAWYASNLHLELGSILPEDSILHVEDCRNVLDELRE